MGIIAILSMSYITTRVVKTLTSLAKIPRVTVENQITTLSVVKIAIKFSPCSECDSDDFLYVRESQKNGPLEKKSPEKRYFRNVIQLIKT